MGCAASAAETKGSTVSTQMPPSEWKISTMAILQKTFLQEVKTPWYEEIANKVSTIDETDCGFTGEKRFEDVLMLRADLPELVYNPKSPHKLWKLLEDDLSDVRNPVGSLLQTFSLTLARFHIESVHEVASAQRVAEASFLLASLTAIVLKTVYVLREALLLYYGILADLLRTRSADVENLLVNCVVQGDLYILMQRLANVLSRKQAEMLKKNIMQRDCESTEEIVISRLRPLLQDFTLTENIVEKRLLLSQLEDEISSASDSKSLLISSLLCLGLQSLATDLLLTKLLTSESPKILYTLIECVDSATTNA